MILIGRRRMAAGKLPVGKCAAYQMHRLVDEVRNGCAARIPAFDGTGALYFAGPAHKIFMVNRQT
jgi:hypothetical protein